SWPAPTPNRKKTWVAGASPGTGSLCLEICSHRRFGFAAGAEPGAAVAFRPDRLPPPAVVEIPRDGLAQAGLDALAGLPAELAAELCRIHRIALVVARAVGDKGDETGVRPIGRSRREFVEEAADRGDDLEVGA